MEILSTLVIDRFTAADRSQLAVTLEDLMLTEFKDFTVADYGETELTQRLTQYSVDKLKEYNEREFNRDELFDLYNIGRLNGTSFKEVTPDSTWPDVLVIEYYYFSTLTTDDEVVTFACNIYNKVADIEQEVSKAALMKSPLAKPVDMKNYSRVENPERILKLPVLVEDTDDISASRLFRTEEGDMYTALNKLIPVGMRYDAMYNLEHELDYNFSGATGGSMIKCMYIGPKLIDYLRDKDIPITNLEAQYVYAQMARLIIAANSVEELAYERKDNTLEAVAKLYLNDEIKANAASLGPLYETFVDGIFGEDKFICTFPDRMNKMLKCFATGQMDPVACLGGTITRYNFIYFLDYYHAAVTHIIIGRLISLFGTRGDLTSELLYLIANVGCSIYDNYATSISLAARMAPVNNSDDVNVIDVFNKHSVNGPQRLFMIEVLQCLPSLR